MAHFAQIGLNNKVISVTRIDDSIITDANNNQVEQLGVDFLANLSGWAIWKRTWKDNSQRKRFAGKGFIYDEDNDVFMPPKPHPSWVINKETFTWTAPIAYPTDGGYYVWNETTQSWQDAEIVENEY